jgi:hypothetical protein
MIVIGQKMCQRNESCVLIGPGVNAVSKYKSCGRHDEYSNCSVSKLEYGSVEVLWADIVIGNQGYHIITK